MFRKTKIRERCRDSVSRERDMATSRDRSPKRGKHCAWCKRSLCAKLERYTNKYYCCQCLQARTETLSEFDKNSICIRCLYDPFVCTECYRSDCSSLDWDYGLGDSSGLHCCRCYDGKGGMPSDCMCLCCQQLGSSSSSEDSEDNASSSAEVPEACISSSSDSVSSDSSQDFSSSTSRCKCGKAHVDLSNWCVKRKDARPISQIGPYELRLRREGDTCTVSLHQAKRQLLLTLYQQVDGVASLRPEEYKFLEASSISQAILLVLSKQVCDTAWTQSKELGWLRTTANDPRYEELRQCVNEQGWSCTDFDFFNEFIDHCNYKYLLGQRDMPQMHYLGPEKALNKAGLEVFHSIPGEWCASDSAVVPSAILSTIRKRCLDEQDMWETQHKQTKIGENAIKRLKGAVALIDKLLAQ